MSWFSFLSHAVKYISRDSLKWYSSLHLMLEIELINKFVINTILQELFDQRQLNTSVSLYKGSNESKFMLIEISKIRTKQESLLVLT